ncbi:hypothetical protein B0H16DRAFT_45687, partial [Mycena metata]
NVLTYRLFPHINLKSLDILIHSITTTNAPRSTPSSHTSASTAPTSRSPHRYAPQRLTRPVLTPRAQLRSNAAPLPIPPFDARTRPFVVPPAYGPTPRCCRLPRRPPSYAGVKRPLPTFPPLGCLYRSLPTPPASDVPAPNARSHSPSASRRQPRLRAHAPASAPYNVPPLVATPAPSALHSCPRSTLTRAVPSLRAVRCPPHPPDGATRRWKARIRNKIGAYILLVSAACNPSFAPPPTPNPFCPPVRACYSRGRAWRMRITRRVRRVYVSTYAARSGAGLPSIVPLSRCAFHASFLHPSSFVPAILRILDSSHLRRPRRHFSIFSLLRMTALISF